VCDRIGRWVQKAAHRRSGLARLAARAIGNDRAELCTLNANLDIWDAYATIHLLMPDGSMKTGGEAVAEVLRRLPATELVRLMFRHQPVWFQAVSATAQSGLHHSRRRAPDLRLLQLRCGACLGQADHSV